MGDQTSCDSHGGILLRDLRYALRTLNRARGFALTVVLVTAIGVGANKATFSVADFVLPLPFPEPNSRVRRLPPLAIAVRP